MRPILIAIVLACFSGPAVADEFCDALNMVVNDARTNFENVRGVVSTRQSYLYDAPVVSLPGAIIPYPGSSACDVRNMMTAAGSVSMYNCSFSDSAYAAQQAAMEQALTDRVGVCLGIDMNAARVENPALTLYQLDNARIQIDHINHPDGGWARILLTISPPDW